MEVKLYIENPKTKGSGIICCIPQAEECPIKCPDCFFQSGRSYLEPLSENLPNVPGYSLSTGRIVRMNDGNDSNNNADLVKQTAKLYDHVFFNTSIPNIAHFEEPTVLTINPAKMTDVAFHKLNPIPNNLMFVRFRVNMWNLDLLKEAIDYYTEAGFPVVLTYMAYYTSDIPEEHKDKYTFRKRTLNEYWCLKPEYVKAVKMTYAGNPLVYHCDSRPCKHCGNCVREYYVTVNRLKEKD